jgi:hypothetical protein
VVQSMEMGVIFVIRLVVWAVEVSSCTIPHSLHAYHALRIVQSVIIQKIVLRLSLATT